MMDYLSCIERLFHASAVKGHYDLKWISSLDTFIGSAWKSYPIIHVAGSNGKGSVATKIASALRAEGYRVGLYTSPHLFTFRERIVCNGDWISKTSVVQGLQKIFKAESELGLQASFFELTTLLAFSYFKEQNVDFAVIETGLGGRLDATNVIEPISTIITSISLEHTQLLGEHLEAIAEEKAGIIKENIPLILGPKARFKAIYDRAKQCHSPLFVSKKISQFFDEENSAIAELALEHLPVILSPAAIKIGLQARPACRFEQQAEVIFDVAHNPDAIFHLLQALHTFFPKRAMRFVVGFSSDKDYESCLHLISDVSSHIHLVQASYARAATLEALLQVMEKIKTPYLLHETVGEGVQQAHKIALQKEELLVITGSFYIMAEAKEALGIYLPKDFLDHNEKILSESLLSSKWT